MTVGWIRDPWAEAADDAAFAHERARMDAARAQFERTAAELAGPDETLRRVLSARLWDAFVDGMRLSREEDHIRFEVRFRLQRQLDGPKSVPHANR